MKFTPAGGSVTLSVRQRGGDIEIEVSDTGIGIEPSQLSKVFDQYCRYAPDASIDGCGLGLYIVKAVVEAHGGNIAISSALGQGTTVTVRLPLKSCQVTSPAAGRQTTSAAQFPRSPALALRRP